MANMLLSDPEWDFLAGESGDVLKLYVVLKRRMDFDTHIAGLKTRINETVLRDAYVIDPVQGRAKPKPITRQRYRSGIARLEKLGLLERIGTLVFFFPQAPWPTFAQNSNNQKSGGQKTISCAALQALNASNSKACGDFNPQENAGLQPAKSASNNLLPAFRAFNLLTSPSSAAQSQEEAVEQSTPQGETDVAPASAFPMSLDWQPDRPSLETLASALGVSLEGLTDEVLSHFRVYWAIEHDNPIRLQTQQKWELQLVRHLENRRKHAEKQAQRAAGQAQAAEPSPSGVQPDKPRQKASGKVVHLRTGLPVSAAEPPKPQEQAMPSVQTNELLSLLWQEMNDLFGWKFKSQFGKQPSPAWARALEDLDSSKIMTGLRNLYKVRLDLTVSVFGIVFCHIKSSSTSSV